MPICKHLKPVGECPECRPKTERVGYFLTSFGAIPMEPEEVRAFDDHLREVKGKSKLKPPLTQAIVDEVAQTLNKAGKFGQVRDAVQKINGKTSRRRGGQNDNDTVNRNRTAKGRSRR